MSCLLIAIDYDDIYQIQTTVVSFTQVEALKLTACCDAETR